MLQVPVREFRLKSSKYINKLPIALTRWNIVIAVVITKEDADKFLEKKTNE